MKIVVKIKYLEINSQDGYETASFYTYRDFTRWFIDNRKNISIMNITEP